MLLGFLKKGLESLCLTDKIETKKIVSLMAVSVFWDREIDEREIQAAREIIFDHFAKRGADEEEIQYIYSEFRDRLQQFQNNERIFREDRIWLNKLIKEDNYEDRYCIKYAKGILEADGYISSSEMEIMRTILSKTTNHKGKL